MAGFCNGNNRLTGSIKLMNLFRSRLCATQLVLLWKKQNLKLQFKFGQKRDLWSASAKSSGSIKPRDLWLNGMWNKTQINGRLWPATWTKLIAGLQTPWNARYALSVKHLTLKFLSFNELAFTVLSSNCCFNNSDTSLAALHFPLAQYCTPFVSYEGFSIKQCNFKLNYLSCIFKFNTTNALAYDYAHQKKKSSNIDSSDQEPVICWPHVVYQQIHRQNTKNINMEKY
jgi:hypothetical protein